MHYFNEFDPSAAAWLRELMAEGLIPKGIVDERSITEVRPEDLAGFVQCHFFAGIGGWSLALRLAGVPDDEPGIWTGSCPCQPFSAAGKRAGAADERHLWPAFFRLIAACRPRVVFGEQVASADVVGKAGSRAQSPAPVWLDGVFADLEGASYTCGAADLPAACVGAPHIRSRLFWVADRGLADTDREQNDPTEPGQQVLGAGLDSVSRNGGAVRGIEAVGATGVADAGHWQRRRSDVSESRRGHAAERGQAATHTERCSGTDDCGLADAELQRTGQERASEGGRDRPAIDGIDGGLVYPGRTGPQGHAGYGDDGDQPGRDGADAAGHASEAGSIGGMADADGAEPGRGQLRLHASDGSGDGTAGVEEQPTHKRLEHTTGDGRGQGRAGADGRGIASRCRVDWSDSRIIACRDGKARRIPRQVEPVLLGVANGLPGGVDDVRLASLGFPLAGKIQNRVGLLRGFGNAIVPQVAATFIQAFLETCGESRLNHQPERTP